MTKKTFLAKAKDCLAEINCGKMLPMEAHDLLLELARDIADDHTRYGKRSVWDSFSENKEIKQ